MIVSDHSRNLITAYHQQRWNIEAGSGQTIRVRLPDTRLQNSSAAEKV